MNQLTIMENIGDDYKLPIPFKTAALNILMTNKSDAFHQIKEQAKLNIPSTTAPEDTPKATFDNVILKLREYITDKRLETNYRTKKDDMDIRGIEGTKEEEDEEGYDEWGNPVDINGVGKGYKGWGKGTYKGGKGGKGKGKEGIQCYNCQQHGHIAKDCTAPKGGGKGGGKNIQCYQCGQYGHIAANCLKGKGYGKGWGKRGIQEVDYQQNAPYQPTIGHYWPQQGGFNLGGGMTIQQILQNGGNIRYLGQDHKDNDNDPTPTTTKNPRSPKTIQRTNGAKTSISNRYIALETIEETIEETIPKNNPNKVPKDPSKWNVLSKNKRGRLTGGNSISRDVEIKPREISGVEQQ